MALSSSMALRRAGAYRLLFSNLIRPASVSRSFNTNARVVDVERRSDRSVSRRRDPSPSFFPDALDPFSPPRSLNQVLNLMDQFLDNPFVSPVSRRGWLAKEDDNNLILKMDMPGLSKEDVRVSVQQNTQIIKGEGPQNESESGGGDDDQENGRRYSTRIDLPSNLYKFDDIKAGMKNGVLKIVVPKVKEDEAKNVFKVNVE
ncbi:heat shock 22 kDa protein, mitochondrial [Citrus clementina]|uniref:heat shock 22 kDa protein, mitochondrial n=1 Tax=Citrus clementina TaxID=85681 RepID=UPI000CED4A06|nr:heat shock 22 kDa protein, mitochondrial [Citrus x clementina]